MTNEEFERDCLDCSVVKKWIASQAKRYSKVVENKEDFRQEALLAIASMPGCPGTDACRDLTQKMIYSAYRQYVVNYRKSNKVSTSMVYRQPGEEWDMGGWKEIGDGCYQRREQPASDDMKDLSRDDWRK